MPAGGRAGGEEGTKRTAELPKNNSRTSCALLITQAYPASQPTRDDSRPGVGAKLPGVREVWGGAVQLLARVSSEKAPGASPRWSRVEGRMWPRQTDRDRGLAAGSQARVPAINQPCKAGLGVVDTKVFQGSWVTLEKHSLCPRAFSHTKSISRVGMRANTLSRQTMRELRDPGMALEGQAIGAGHRVRSSRPGE